MKLINKTVEPIRPALTVFIPFTISSQAENQWSADVHFVYKEVPMIKAQHRAKLAQNAVNCAACNSRKANKNNKNNCT